jgi:hypothetical protein
MGVLRLLSWPGSQRLLENSKIEHLKPFKTSLSAETINKAKEHP